MLSDKNYSQVWQKKIDTVGFYSFRQRSIKSRVFVALDFLRMGIVELTAKLTKFLTSPSFKHARGLRFLRKKGLLGAYRKTLTKFNAVSTLSAIHNFYFLNFLENFKLFPNRPLNVLEIGAGGGIFAILFSENHPLSHYVIVDLPEMLEVSKRDIAKFKPKMKVSFLTPEEFKARPAYFDAIFNFNSFSEMNRDVLNRYFELVYQSANTGAIFYNVNYMQTRHGLNNNPLLFPYRGSEIVCWQSSPLHYAAKGSLNRDPQLSLIRIDRIVKAI
jgi:putative sugar O-methyltransferase